jgi:predicted CoA-binding protein
VTFEEDVLRDYRTVAVVGLSSNEERPSNSVAAYLKEHGYRIIPVNPGESEVLGEKSYPDLRSVPEPVEVVQVFRRPEDVPEIVEQAIEIGAKVVWMQEGVVNEEAARRAREAGLTVVMDRCMRTEHRRMTAREASRQ